MIYEIKNNAQSIRTQKTRNMAEKERRKRNFQVTEVCVTDEHEMIVGLSHNQENS